VIIDKSIIKKKFNVPNNAFLIGTAGRLVAEKGFDIFIKGAKQFLLHNYNALFLIAGDGPLLSKLKLSVKKYGIERSILFLGFTDRIYDYLSILDIFVLSSLTEGLPIILLEAMNAGCPVVCSRVGGIPEVIEDKINGSLVKPNDPFALCEALLGLYKNDSQRKEIACQARNRVSDSFSAKKMASEYTYLYDNCFIK